MTIQFIIIQITPFFKNNSIKGSFSETVKSYEKSGGQSSLSLPTTR